MLRRTFQKNSKISPTQGGEKEIRKEEAHYRGGDKDNSEKWEACPKGRKPFVKKKKDLIKGRVVLSEKQKHHYAFRGGGG